MAELLCNHCEKFFPGSPKHKNRMYCNKPGCQKARKAAWQRKKMRMDSDYRLNQKLCNKNWAKTHPDYWKEYRRKNPKKAERNRMLQSLRNRRRSRKQELSAKMNTSAIAKMDASIFPQNLASGQFWLVPAIAKMDAEKGQNLFRTNGCLGCHSIGAEGELFASDLSNVGNKVKPDWLINWLLDPHAYDSNTVMPNFRLSIKEAKDISTFLLTQKTKPIAESSGGEPTPEKIKQGKELIKKRGCTACHEINGIDPTRIGPELSKIGAKLASHLDFGHTTKEDVERTWMSWVENRLKDPTIYNTETIKANMPTFSLSDKDRKAIAVFLRGMDGRTAHSDLTRKLSTKEFEIDRGKKTIAKYNCKGCHVIDGSGGNVFKFYKSKYYAPPPLEVNGLRAGERLKDSWMYPFLREPAPVRKWLNVKMPTFQLGEDEIFYIMRYFGDVNGGLPKHLGAKIQPVEKGPVANGGRLFSHYCSPCHGDKGMGDGFNSAKLDPTPRDLSDAKEVYMGKQKNEDLFKVISLGGKAVDKSPRMPPYGNTLSEKEIWEIVGFLRTLHPYKGEAINFTGLQTKRPQKAAEKISAEKFKGIKRKAVLKGKSLYKKLGCSACHTIGEQGGIVGPELTHVSKRLNSAWVYQFLLSPQHMLADITMPNYGLNNKKALSLATYLHSLN